ncbi:MAG: NADH-quinone oxidoreductase subunit L [Anaerolineae bacterium]|nr:NADH-quinone oxidoreductase subunit L [Anaerolineae bacterium]
MSGNLAWLIPVFPMLAFAAILLFTQRYTRLSHWLALGGIGLAFIVAQLVFWAAVFGALDISSLRALPWLVIGGATDALGVWLDPPALIMLFMVPLVCLMIFIYSTGYMRGDSRYGRFFAYISLFAAAMLGLVLFDNLLAFFVCWELMGLCSYLLIGFWHERPTAAAAGLKAFLVTKVGDLFFFLGLMVLYATTGSLAYRDLFTPEVLALLAQPGYLGLPVTPAFVVALLLFGGTVGKSAQFPLHVWLPDAMAGPTPVSALIHAATMVSAGVFLLVRVFPLLVVAGLPLPAIAYIGAFTALLGAVVALGQDDIKRVLAFSTMSQLGYMVAALGMGAYVAAFFHLFTHAFFKALLFLGAGSVIHGMEHGYHHSGSEAAFDPNDLLVMGGLRRTMPRTFATFLIGGLSLAGFPLFTAGFWSKDEILAQAFGRNPLIFWVLAAAALLTAFYTARQICLVFLGSPRSEPAVHARESNRAMTTPLWILAGFAIVLGWLGIPEHFPVLGGIIPNWFDEFVMASPSLLVEPLHSPHALHAWQPLATGGGACLLGLGLGWVVYGWRPPAVGAPDRIATGMRRLHLGWFYRALQERLYFDWLYQRTIVWGAVALAGLTARFDDAVPDGIVRGVAASVRALAAFAAGFDEKVVDAFVNFWATLARWVARGLNWFDLHLVDPVINFAGWLGQLGPWATGSVEPEVPDAPVGPIPRLLVRVGGALSALQSGEVQDYLGFAFFVAIALTVAFLL